MPFIDPMILTFLILGITILVFISDKFRMDVVSISALVALYLTGLVNNKQAIAGFSSSTVIMITGLFVVGAGLFRTGVADWISEQLIQYAGSNQTKLLFVLMLGTGILSGFLSNTGTVAVLLPAVVAAAWRVKTTPTKLLLPLAVAANVGGLLTLIGTPPNIVVSDALVTAGETPIGFFEFGLIGLPLLGVAIIYMFVMGRNLLPDYKSDDNEAQASTSPQELAESYDLTLDLHQVRVRSTSKLAGKTLAEAALGRDFNISVLHVERAPVNEMITNHHMPLQDFIETIRQGLQEEDEIFNTHPSADTVIEVSDTLLIRGELDAVNRLALAFDLAVLQDDPTTEQTKLSLVEVLIVPRSSLIGMSLSQAHFGQKYGVQVVGVMRRGKAIEAYQTTKLAFGDALLVNGTPQEIKVLKNEPRNFVVVGKPISGGQSIGLRPKAYVALFAMVAMMGMMLTGIVSSDMAVLITALFMVITGCLNMEQAYKAINWESVIMIAAMIPMSTALQETGGAEFIANGLVTTLGGTPIFLLAGVFLLTVTFTQVISNTATSILIAPIAIGAALDLGLSPHPLMMMVAVGASTAFVTPIASPVNMLVLNPGSYKFADFMKVGLPLAAVFLIVSLIIVPLIWPL